MPISKWYSRRFDNSWMPRSPLSVGKSALRPGDVDDLFLRLSNFAFTTAAFRQVDNKLSTEYRQWQFTTMRDGIPEQFDVYWEQSARDLSSNDRPFQKSTSTVTRLFIH
jgi:hypothetical protein